MNRKHSSTIFRPVVFLAVLGLFFTWHGLHLRAAGLFDAKNSPDKSPVKIAILCGQSIDGKSEAPLKNAAILSANIFSPPARAIIRVN